MGPSPPPGRPATESRSSRDTFTPPTSTSPPRAPDMIPARPRALPPWGAADGANEADTGRPGSASDQTERSGCPATPPSCVSCPPPASPPPPASRAPPSAPPLATHSTARPRMTFSTQPMYFSLYSLAHGPAVSSALPRRGLGAVLAVSQAPRPLPPVAKPPLSQNPRGLCDCRRWNNLRGQQWRGGRE